VSGEGAKAVRDGLREPTVTCDECGWSVRNDGDFDLHGSVCLYPGECEQCQGTLEYSSINVLGQRALGELWDRLKVPEAQRRFFVG